jgi:hypothetical protein
MYDHEWGSEDGDIRARVWRLKSEFYKVEIKETTLCGLFHSVKISGTLVARERADSSDEMGFPVRTMKYFVERGCNPAPESLFDIGSLESK